MTSSPTSAPEQNTNTNNPAPKRKASTQLSPSQQPPTKQLKSQSQSHKKKKVKKKSHQPHQCSFYIASKKRFCRQGKLKNSEFCTNHFLQAKDKELGGEDASSQLTALPSAAAAADANNASTDETNSENLILHCPACNTAIKQSKYESHLRICPRIKRNNNIRQQPYYSKNINGNVPKNLTSLKDIKKEFESQEAFMEFVRRIETVFEEALKDSKQKWNRERDGMKFWKQEESLSEEGTFQTHFPVQIEQPSCLSEYLSNEDQVSKNKHMFQQASIVGIVIRNKCMNQSVRYLDMGAGKAEMSLTFAQALRARGEFSATEDITTTADGSETGTNRCASETTDKDAEDTTPLAHRFVLVDRKAFRRKSDNKIRLEHPQITKQNLKQHQDSVVKRLDIDIQDLNIGRVETLKSRDTVCISKHLCGVATDLSLRCLQNTNKTSPSSSSPHTNLKGYFICLCCHQICCWQEYINQEYWTSTLKLSPSDFTKVKSLSSWTVAAFRDTNGAPDSIFSSLSNVEKEQFGWKCKRLIDFGRIDFLRQNGYDAYLVQYIGRNVSPECLMMVAVPSRRE